VLAEQIRHVVAEPHGHRRQAVGHRQVGEQTAVDDPTVMTVRPEPASDDQSGQYGWPAWSVRRR